MTTSVKTQCPNCQAIYPIPEQYLNNPDAPAKCTQCQTVFKVNEHRMAVDDMELSLDVFKEQTTSAQQDVSASEIVATQTDQTKENSVEQSSDLADTSVDEMSQWLEQQMADLNAVNDNEDNHSSRENDGSDQDDIEEDELDLPEVPLEATAEDLSTDDLLQSQTQSNLAKVNDKGDKANNGDSAWEDDLLGDVETDNRSNIAAVSAIKPSSYDNKSVDKQPGLSNADLGDLLSEYGVDSEKIKEETPEERLAKIRSRVDNHQPTSQQIAMKKSPVVNGLWIVGCLLMLLLMLTQYVIFNSNDLLKNPKYASVLHGVCKSLSCKLPEADASQFVISVRHRVSQVKPADAHSDIIGGMVNVGEDEQLLPNLNVTLSQGGKAVAGFIATPDEYLIAPQQVLGSKQLKIFMFTVPMKDADYEEVTVESFY